MKKDEELLNYRRQIGDKQYDNEYHALYVFARDSKFRYSKREYENYESKLKSIKEKYKNGVSKDIINEMLDIKD